MRLLRKGLVVTATTLGAIMAPPTAGAEERPTYTVEYTEVMPAEDATWDGALWKDIPALDIACFYRTELSEHRPRTQAKVLYDERGLYLRFRVEDRYVRSIETSYHGKVWEDACVEFFVEPVPGRGYFNFEINAGGTLLLSYKENPTWTGETLEESGPVPWELAQRVEIFHTLPAVVEPELAGPVVWEVAYHIPYAVFTTYLGELGTPRGQVWRANFYKCAENNSHPHWASWSLITKELNFHQPEFFSEIHFEK